MNDAIVESLEILALKEAALSNIIVWLKARGLWEACAKDVGLPYAESKIEDLERERNPS